MMNQQQQQQQEQQEQQQRNQQRRRLQQEEQQQHHPYNQQHYQQHQQQYLYPPVNNNNLDLPLPFFHGLVGPMVMQSYHHHHNYQIPPIENFVSEPLSSTRARVETAPLPPPPAAAAAAAAETSSTNRKRVRLAQHHEVVALVEDMTETERDNTWWRQEDFDDTKANVKQMCRGLRKQRRFSNCLTDAYERACGMNCPDDHHH